MCVRPRHRPFPPRGVCHVTRYPPIRIHTGIEQTAEQHGPPAAYVRVDVRDTGADIALADRERIFEPFFTSKEAGKGSGLGLASVRRIVDRAGGFVRVESSVGEGSTLRLYFPRVTSGV